MLCISIIYKLNISVLYFFLFFPLYFGILQICKVKNAISKAMALAMAFKKKQQRFQGLSSTRGRATRQLLIEHQRTKPSETPEEETRNSNEQGELSRNKTNKQDGKLISLFYLHIF